MRLDPVAKAEVPLEKQTHDSCLEVARKAGAVTPSGKASALECSSETHWVQSCLRAAVDDGRVQTALETVLGSTLSPSVDTGPVPKVVGEDACSGELRQHLLDALAHDGPLQQAAGLAFQGPSQGVEPPAIAELSLDRDAMAPSKAAPERSPDVAHALAAPLDLACRASSAVLIDEDASDLKVRIQCAIIGSSDGKPQNLAQVPGSASASASPSPSKCASTNCKSSSATVLAQVHQLREDTSTLRSRTSKLEVEVERIRNEGVSLREAIRNSLDRGEKQHN